MKGNRSFILLVASLLLISSLVLIGGMTIVAAGGETKPYDLDFTTDVVPPITQSTLESLPPQTTHQEKFSAMAQVDEEANAITLISLEYLQEYWQDNYEKEVIHSLTLYEVMYIIQDSIRLYYEGGYTQIRLPGFTASQPELTQRFPQVEEWICCGPVRNQQENLKNIQQIIFRRLQLLSSPCVFMARTDGIRTFYVPDFSQAMDREYLAYYFSGMMDSIPTPESIPVYFAFDHRPGYVIEIRESGVKSTVFPTTEMLPLYSANLETDAGWDGCQIYIDTTTGRCAISRSAYQSFALTGSFGREGDHLLLTLQSENPSYEWSSALSLQWEDGHFVSLSDFQDMGIQAGMIFYGMDEALWESLLYYIPSRKHTQSAWGDPPGAGAYRAPRPRPVSAVPERSSSDLALSSGNYPSPVGVVRGSSPVPGDLASGGHPFQRNRSGGQHLRLSDSQRLYQSLSPQADGRRIRLAAGASLRAPYHG